MIIHEKKLIFIHVPKTAGTSITHSLLTETLGYETTGTIYQLPKEIKKKYSIGSSKYSIGSEGVLRTHSSALNIQQHISKKIWNSYYKFAFVRNPWDRLVSSYHFFISRDGNKLSFKKYINNYLDERHKHDKYTHQTQTQLSYISSNGEILVDDIFQYENLLPSLKVIETKSKAVFSPIRHWKKREIRKPYNTYYTPVTRDIVHEYYYDDIQLFKYKFNEY